MISRSLGQRFESLDLNSGFSLSLSLFGSLEAVIIPNYAETGHYLGVLTTLLKFYFLINYFHRDSRSQS